MAFHKVKSLPQSLKDAAGFIAIHHDTVTGEYRVRIIGNPAADYFTTDKQDAFSTAQFMRNNLRH